MNYKLDKLSNGLRLITVPIPSMESATITIWIGVGSRYETDKVSGISHFLEHMVFKGSKKRPTAKEIAEAVDSIGGEFNASTGKEWTNFYIKAGKSNIETAFDVLSDMVLNPILREDDLEREKGVIVEEIGMYEDTPMWKISDLFENLIFKGNDLGRDIIGIRKTVKALTTSDFEKYRNTHYGGNNIVITVAGGITQKESLKLTKKYFSGLKKTKKQSINKFVAKQKSPKILLSSQQKEQAHFILGFLGGKRGEEQRYAETILSTILGSGMSSRLFTEIREKRGLAYSVKASNERFLDTGYMDVYAGVDPKKADEAIKVILDQVYGVTNGKHKITEKELIKAKEYIKGHVALSLEDTKAINAFFGTRELMEESIETPDELYKKIDAVTIPDLEKAAKKFFKPENLNLAIIGPFKNKDKFVKLIK